MEKPQYFNKYNQLFIPQHKFQKDDLILVIYLIHWRLLPSLHASKY